MRKVLALFLIVAIGATLSCAGGLYEQQGKQVQGLHGHEEKKHPGLEPYSPSQIEWLVMLLNSQFRTQGNLPPFFDYDSQDPETVIIYWHLPAREIADAESIMLAQSRTQSMRGHVRMIAEHYRWDWVKVREEAVSATRKWSFRGWSDGTISKGP